MKCRECGNNAGIQATSCPHCGARLMKTRPVLLREYALKRSRRSNGHQWWRNYNHYLNSRDWQRTRKAALRRDRYQCQKCGSRGSRRNPLQANHLSYSAFNATGRTPLADLQTLCQRCHQKLTRRGVKNTGRRFKNDSQGNQFLSWIVIIAIALLAYTLIYHHPRFLTDLIARTGRLSDWRR